MGIVIKNARIVNATGTCAGDIAIDAQGKIAAIGADLSGETVIDAEGRLVTPGGVDVHTHLQYHVCGCDTSDTFASGMRAAAFGGTTTVMDFVEAQPQEPLAQALERRRAQAQGNAFIDYSLHMSRLPDDIGKLDQVRDLVQQGCPTFKHYMAYGFALDDGQLYRSFQAIAQAGGMAVVHAENWAVIQQLIADLVQAGETHPRNHLKSRPAPLEGQAVGRALDVAALTQAPIYICHMTCREDVEQLMRARHQGLRAWGETCPHYLCLNEDVFETLGALAVCSPPIRPEAQRQALVTALLQGELHTVSTDHCPFTKAEKYAPGAFNKTPGGLSAIESRLMLVRDLPGMSLERWVDCCCTTPARVMGLTSKGQLAPGFDADLVIWEDAPHTLSADTLHERADWSPYEGRQVSCRPQTVMSRGEIIVRGGEFLAQPGRGRYLARRLS